MTDSDTDFTAQGEILFCARHKNSSRLSGSVNIRTLLEEISSLIPVDKLYALLPLPGGNYALREAGSIGLGFFPTHASPLSLEEEILNHIEALKPVVQQIAQHSQTSVVAQDTPISLPSKKRASKMKDKALASKSEPKAKPEPAKVPANAIPTQAGHLVSNGVIKATPEQSEAASLFGKV